MNELDNILAKIAETEEEPSEGHYERFNKKLRYQASKNQFTLWLKIAAVFVLCYFAGSLLLVKYGNQQLVLTKDQKEMKDAGIYYTNQIRFEMTQVQQLVNEGAGSEKDLWEVKKELSAMDTQFRNLNMDYQANPNDERLQNAVIQYYQSKLEILNIVKNDLENVKQQKLKYHENNKI